MLSWTIGREFADGTVTGLSGLPVQRWAIVTGKLLVYLMWTIVVSAVLLGLVTAAGFAMCLEGTPQLQFARIPILAVLSGLIAIPASGPRPSAAGCSPESPPPPVSWSSLRSWPPLARELGFRSPLRRCGLWAPSRSRRCNSASSLPYCSCSVC